MTFWVAIAGGFAGTLVLTIILRTATELNLTRIDLPFLLGTALVENRSLAKALGYVLHFVLGFGFAAIYYLLVLALGRHDWWLGALFGLAHGIFSGTVLINVLLPLVHPRMGTPLSDATDTAWLEPPGFLARNYGTQTAVVLLLAHILYGTLIAGFLDLAR
jgi:hypothetical protein